MMTTEEWSRVPARDLRIWYAFELFPKGELGPMRALRFVAVLELA